MLASCCDSRRPALSGMGGLNCLSFCSTIIVSRNLPSFFLLLKVVCSGPDEDEGERRVDEVLRQPQG